MKKLLLAVAALCVSYSPAFAGQDEDYYKTSAVTVTSEETVTDLTDKDVFPVPLRNTIPDTKVVAAGAIVNGGVQAWNVINSGKPDANLSSSYASAIPGFSFNWANFSGWKKKEVVYTYTVTNLMQVDVIKIKYAVSFYYNGQNLVAMRAGTDPISTLAQRNDAIKGHYITNFTVRPLTMNIKWGWKFSLNVRMSDPMNVGTADAPVAHLQADLNYIVSTPFSTNGGMWTYDVTGLGGFRDLSEQNRARTLAIPPLEPVDGSTMTFN
ncbi:MAG: hypothetical protein A2X32_00405 [Elusimicrobia bacterium GWC2_64_44]|nr:MAG: hypothetical protein A2X32_00405 [Elusimicrobia bacterium GWC2_64_44]